MTLFLWDEANLDDWKVTSSVCNALRKVSLGRVLILLFDSSNRSREAMILCKTRNKLFEPKLNPTRFCNNCCQKAHNILTQIFKSLHFQKDLRVEKRINAQPPPSHPPKRNEVRLVCKCDHSFAVGFGHRKQKFENVGRTLA